MSEFWFYVRLVYHADYYTNTEKLRSIYKIFREILLRRWDQQTGLSLDSKATKLVAFLLYPVSSCRSWMSRGF